MSILVEKIVNASVEKPLYVYTIENNNNMRVRFTNIGASILSIELPDKNGKLIDVALGYNNIESYLNNTACFGAIIARNSNRIHPAEVVIDNVKYALEKNDGENNLHSGSNGAAVRIFNGDVDDFGNTLRFKTILTDLSDGFPGNLQLDVCYALTDDNILKIVYHAKSDKDTIINPTNHSYFNLEGHNHGSIESHSLQLDASNYHVLDSTGVPTGEVCKVAATPFDFLTSKKLADVAGSDHPHYTARKGFDHNFILNGEGLRKFGTVSAPISGISMDIHTDQPCVQFYAGGYLGNQAQGKETTNYEPFSGFCLETQHTPNAPHLPLEKSTMLKKNTEFCTETWYAFKV